MMEGSKTIREAFVEASSFLRQRGVEDAKASTELLLQHLLGWNRTQLLFGWQEPFPCEEELAWQILLSRRADGEPVQYLIGEQDFYGLPFTVTPAVLIPRPETEILVAEIVSRGMRLWPDGEPVLADIGTGTGAIPITAAVKCPRWKVKGVDISEAALEVARSNAIRNGVAERVAFLRGDLLEPLVREKLAVDILVSNPPYIPSGDIEGLQTEVRDHEPHLALDGGADGLDFYRRIIASLSELPALPRLVGFEVGLGQARDVADMLRGSGSWARIDIIPDLAGIERHVIAEA